MTEGKMGEEIKAIGEINDPAKAQAGEFLSVVVADPGEEKTSVVPGDESINIVVEGQDDQEAGKKINGKNFTIDGDMAIIFDQKGKKRPDGLWDMPLGESWRVANPEPKSPKVLAAIKEDIANNDFDRISRVLISHDVALFLFLEGVLTAEHFQAANEDQVDTAPIFGEKDQTLDPAITLSSVTFGEHTFPVTILSCDCIGKDIVATLDENWKKI